jgi:hypothetical protein
MTSSAIDNSEACLDLGRAMASIRILSRKRRRALWLMAGLLLPIALLALPGIAQKVPRRLAGLRGCTEFPGSSRRGPRSKTTSGSSTRTDFSLANHLAARNPTKLKEMQNLFIAKAVKYYVRPLDDRILERLILA